MSDWQVGDLAVCVDDGPDWQGVSVGLENGNVYSVAEVVPMAPGNIRWKPGTGLNLVGISCGGLWGFSAERFRKILPDKHEECEPEFVTLLKRIKHTVSA